jgi:large subunit ribosomal protein L17
MRHRVAQRKLGRTSEHRMALLRNLSTALLDKERITTTLTKAKELRSFAEKLVTMSKKETLHARRLVLRHIHDRKVVAKLFDTLSARYSQRPGGYTRIIKLGPRRGDHAEMALIELVGSEHAEEKKDAPASKGKKTKAKPKTSAAKDTKRPQGGKSVGAKTGTKARGGKSKSSSGAASKRGG